jgi:hypothetical protein
MCFMFGASEEQRRRVLADEASREEEVPVSVPATEDWSRD